MYDVIGDVHGHADELRRLLSAMGYAERGGCWRHPDRRAVFLGDFIDRGPDIRGVLRIARGMVEGGTALAVMGNHEFNAVAFRTPHPEREGYLRPHSAKNVAQHDETLQQLSELELEQAVAWFRTLPMWLELGGLRVVHACWDERAIEVVGTHRERWDGFDADFLHLACSDGTELFEAVELLLKGRELALPEGVAFHDKDGHPRRRVRVRWYDDPARSGGTYRAHAFSFRDADRERVPDDPLPAEALASTRPYAADQPPVLFGHYWMPGELEPAPLAPNVACLDYSVASEGRLCAYRWDGESVLRPEGFVFVQAEPGR